MKKLAILIVGLLSACAGIGISGSEDNILLSIGEEKIQSDEFLYAFNKNRSDNAQASREEIDAYLDLYTNFKLKVIEAKQRGMDTTTEFVEEFNSYKDQLDDSYIKSNDDIDSLVKEAYERLQFEINASHILFRLEESAMPSDTFKVYNKVIQVRDSILNGAPFSDLARAISEDPSAKQNGGELGYFTVFQMVYPFETAAYQTSPGEVSMPVRTRFGYHLIKVNDKRNNEGKVRVAHIMIRKRPGDKEKIFELYEMLKAGGEWNNICADYSEDQQTAKRNGVLVPFGKSQMANAPAFAEVAFNLSDPEQISDPVQTNYGWHIIKLIEKLPVSDFEGNERMLKSQVNRDVRSEIGHEKMIERLARENKLIEHEQAVQKIINPDTHNFVKGKWEFNEDSTGNMILFSIQGKDILAEGMFELILKDKNQKSDRGFLFRKYKEFRENTLITFEKSQLVNKYPDYKYLRQEYYDGILLFSIMEDEVWLKASSDSIGLVRYYKSHNEKFIDSTKMKAVIFSAEEESIIKSVKEQIPDVEKYFRLSLSEKEKVLNQYNDSTKLSLQLDSGIFVTNEHPVLENISLSGIGTEILEHNGWHYVLVVRDPREPQPLQEIKGRVIADYQQELENKWIEELRKKYPVNINQAGLKNIYKRLESI